MSFKKIPALPAPAALAAFALSISPAAYAAPVNNQALHGGAAAGYALAAAAGAISAPETVDPGQRVTVRVPGAAEGAGVVIWGPVDSGDSASTLSRTELSIGTAEITAPSRPGSYELRHIAPGGDIVSRQAFDVAAVPVALTVSTGVSTGGSLEVIWRGPGNPGDKLEIVDPATDTTLDSAPLAGSAETRNLTQLPAPSQSGRFELRYVTGDGVVLRSVPFTVRATGG